MFASRVLRRVRGHSCVFARVEPVPSSKPCISWSPRIGVLELGKRPLAHRANSSSQTACSVRGASLQSYSLRFAPASAELRSHTPAVAVLGLG